MSKLVKKVFVMLLSLVALLAIDFILLAEKAGTWEDHPKNWYRAFHEEQPSDVKVVHSKYWRSDHFTDEFIYYFEVEAPPGWRDKYFAKLKLQQVSPETARSFRSSVSDNQTPDWFAPDPVNLYDVWDKAGYFGSVWIDKTNGHIFFYDAQL